MLELGLGYSKLQHDLSLFCIFILPQGALRKVFLKEVDVSSSFFLLDDLLLSSPSLYPDLTFLHPPPPPKQSNHSVVLSEMAFSALGTRECGSDDPPAKLFTAFQQVFVETMTCGNTGA
jgi:hypothetical protein